MIDRKEYEKWLATERDGVIPFTETDKKFVERLLAWKDAREEDSCDSMN